MFINVILFNFSVTTRNFLASFSGIYFIFYKKENNEKNICYYYNNDNSKIYYIIFPIL